MAKSSWVDLPHIYKLQNQEQVLRTGLWLRLKDVAVQWSRNESCSSHILPYMMLRGQRSCKEGSEDESKQDFSTTAAIQSIRFSSFVLLCLIWRRRPSQLDFSCLSKFTSRTQTIQEPRREKIHRESVYWEKGDASANEQSTNDQWEACKLNYLPDVYIGWLVSIHHLD